jgi:hypothetical protein
MLWILALAMTLASGWFLARTFTGPVLAPALAVLFGPGLASVVFFFLVASGHATPATTFATLAALAAGSAALWWKLRAATPPASAEPRRFPWTWALLIALAAGSVLLVLDFQAATQANPDGEWDASAIWNLRARFLSGGPDTWRRAISSELGGFMVGSAHPGYPLFLSSFIALQWTASRNFSTAVPVAFSLLISLALLALLVASLASRRSLPLGILAGLLLLGTELFASQASSQYSDLLEGLAFLASLVLLDGALLDAGADAPKSLIAAGLAIGFAPWIKNEGQPFAIAALALAAWRFRTKGLVWTAIGAAPGLLATAALKLLSQGRESMFPSTAGEALAKLADVSRWWQAFLGFGKAALDAGPLWAHPILLAAALAAVLRFLPSGERRQRLWWAVPIAGVLAAEYGLYLITTADLTWHINTSVERLLAQLWPSLLWLLFSMLCAPEQYYSAAVPQAVPVDRNRLPSGAPRAERVRAAPKRGRKNV